MEVVLSESQEVMRAVPHVLLLPKDPHSTAAYLRQRLMERWQMPVAVIISDSFGRAWRNGVVDIAFGAAGLPSIIDRRSEYDRDGRALESTEVALADAIAAGAALVMGEANEGTPVVIARGVKWTAPERAAAALLRPTAKDLFR